MCSLDFQFSSSFVDDEYRYIYRIDVNIWKYGEDEDTKIDMGVGRCFYLDVERSMNDGASTPDELFDVECGSAAYMGLIYQPNSFDFTEHIQTLYPDSLFDSNLLILDRLELLPGYRGTGLSVRVVREMVYRLGKGVGIAALKPFPLQFESSDSIREHSPRYFELELDAFAGTVESCTDKLARLYRQAGFEYLTGTGIMIMNPKELRPET